MIRRYHNSQGIKGHMSRLYVTLMQVAGPQLMANFYRYYFDYLCLFQSFKTSTFTYDKSKLDAFLNSPVISIAECLGSQPGRRTSVEGLVTQVTVLFYDCSVILVQYMLLLCVGILS